MLCNRIRSTTNADIIHDAIRFVAERQKKERLKLITSYKEDESYYVDTSPAIDPTTY
jgi:tryptophan synthase alpha subunit